ncbi:elongation factor 1 gamma domain-containing protein [Pochonia chlamydosporia 170]|uniref:Elongation factor 1 gamma domain-containing protein n=1 Tax=Pochonia chlamydosporia 170 TaxID=1380566 RepID=A0A179FE14_METCM|nr:elongation factor 1 gamma domain-containing protein [Pochonia chlamydosporia 170]OAQ63481.1 elongation factor 1 gamma domain-containing protein [Pochonia chlamydosporia 170]
MAFGTLFTHSDNPRSVAIKAVAKANNLDLKISEIEFGKPTAEHQTASGLGKIPAFVGEDGFALSEAIAVAIYVTSQNEKTTLLGKTKQDYASILKWMSFFNMEFVGPMGDWFRPLVGKAPYNKKSVDDASKVVEKVVGVIENYLLHNTFLVGERITLADLFCAPLLHRGFQYFFDKQWRQQHPNTTRWYETVINQPIITAVAKPLALLEKPALTNVAPKKPEAPKPAPKPAAPAAQQEEEPAAAPKPKHPLDLLPRASFPLDEWKRQYSNSETPDALKWFWENVPFDEYSIWSAEYKYPEELKLTFMSNNLIGGFNNRMEGSRKYVFGCASVYGEDNDSVIQGAFVIRGQELMPVFDVAPDSEHYNFKKLDPKNAEDRAYLENQWGWEKPVVVNGKEYAHRSGKVFK